MLADLGNVAEHCAPIDQGNAALAHHLNARAGKDRECRVFIDSHAVQVRMLGNDRQQARQSAPLGKVLVEHDLGHKAQPRFKRNDAFLGLEFSLALSQHQLRHC